MADKLDEIIDKVASGQRKKDTIEDTEEEGTRKRKIEQFE